MTLGLRTRDTIHIAIGVPNFGSAPMDNGLLEMARAIADAGFDGAWLTDHILVPQSISSKYPYSSDGTFFHPPEGWYEAITSLSFIASTVPSLELGIGVCVLALRDPRLLAAQLATLDRLTCGRVALGVGAGWLREEFDLLGVDFDKRGELMDGGLALMRAWWRGDLPAGAYGPFQIDNSTKVAPTPQRVIPIYIGGTSPAALRRIISTADGWLGAAGTGGMPVEVINAVREGLSMRCERHGRKPETVELRLRVAASRSDLEGDTLSERLCAYAAQGITSFILDFAWPSIAVGIENLERLVSSTIPVRREPPVPWWIKTA